MNKLTIAARWQNSVLEFKTPATTSRHTLKEHTVYYIFLTQNGLTGTGEAAPLKGLSIDDLPDFEARLQNICDQINTGISLENIDLTNLPSIQFALETALLDLQNGGRKILFDTAFTRSEKPIPINGLVWMNESKTMLSEAFEKVELGYTTIKFKVGALDFDEECRMLENFRKRYSEWKVEIRLDANGAFPNSDALQMLKDLSRFQIHSFEQPIKAGQWEAMQELCAMSPIAVALDEELIGQKPDVKLLQYINPKYLVLKPTLLGGFRVADEWISICKKYEIGWWATSALESNIGLNAIAQWVSQYDNPLPQGLGTGGLYVKNREMPLHLKEGDLHYIV